ncbi:unnamed protein product [Schistosoma turkestanicum]|nr:unnamed protein product [Schistosoma turkestanicum]
MDFAKLNDIIDMELYTHGSTFYNSLEEMFKTLPREISYGVVDQHLQNLMISILTYDTRKMRFGYSASELQHCFKMNDFAAQSVNVFDLLSLNWFKAFSAGLTRYVNTRKTLQMMKTTLNAGPSRSCIQCMRDLSLGCPMLDECFTTNTKQICSNPCNKYCINVFRGCLAPFLLLSSSKQSIYLNEKSIWSSSNPVHFGDLSYLLNATTVYHLIKKGIKETDENGALIQAKLEKFCRKNQSPTSQTTTDLFSNLNGNDHTLNQTTRHYLPFNIAEYDKLNHFIQKVAKDLNSYFYDRNDKIHYMNSIELLYCSQEDKNQCWNGSSFDRYTREVPEFTIDGQLNNPEVKITNNDLKMNNFPKEKNAIQKEMADEQNTEKLNMINDIASVDPALNHKKQPHNEDLFISESSGLNPSLSSIDVDLPRIQSPFVVESNPSNYLPETDDKKQPRPEGVSTDDLTNQIIVQGCFVDDEDCELNIADGSIDISSDDDKQYNENETFYNNSEFDKKKSQDELVNINQTDKETNNKTKISSAKVLNSTTHTNTSTNSTFKENTSSPSKKISSTLIGFICIFSIKFNSFTRFYHF